MSSTAFSMMMNFFRLVGNVFAAAPEDVPIDSSLPPATIQMTDRAGEVAADTSYDYSYYDPDDVDYFEEHVYYLAPYQVFLSHLEGAGLGTNTGYSTLGTFLPGGAVVTSSSSSFEPYLDVRGHVLNDGRLAANVGIGMRNLNYFQYIWGLNLYYDWRKGQLGHYQQVGGGLELLGSHWALRANLYWPVSTKSRLSTPPTIFSDYLGGYVVTCQQREQALRGADAELGFYSRLGAQGFSFYIGAGQYYYNRFCSKDILGGKGRIILQGWNIIKLEGNYFYDTINRSIVTGKITLSFPFGNRARSQVVHRTDTIYEDITVFKELVYQPTLRSEMIYLEEMCQFETFNGAGQRIRLSVIN